MKDETASSALILEQIERSNLFVIPLDDKRQWYRCSVQALLAALVCDRPMLRVGWAWALLTRGDLEAAEQRLQETER